MVGVSGATAFNSDYGGQVRGGIAYNNLAYFVIGDTLYEFDGAGNGTSRGTLNTSAGQVSMAHNGTRTGANQQMMIVDGTTGYIYDNTTSTLSEISDTDMVSADTVVFLDGYFIFSQTDSDRFWISAQYDGTDITGTDFFTAEGSPDEIVSLFADQRTLYILGETTSEAWYNLGDSDNAFQRFQGGFSQTGCAARFSVARFDNSIVWLSKNERGDGQVVRLGEGFLPQVISTQEIDYQISKYSDISSAIAYSYQHEGHEFYVITFPSDNVTWAYDAVTQEWHQRSHDDLVSRERFNCYVNAFGKHLFGDFENGNIYELDGTVGTLNGSAIPKERISPSLIDDERRLRIASIQLNMEEGQGDSETANDTLVWMSWSKDGGHTYSNEISRDLGDEGEYDKRLVWRKLGHARNWTFRMRTSAPTRVVVKDLIGKVYE